MRLEDLIMVSVDDHLVEPPGMFVGRMPAKHADVAPVSVRKPDGTDVWRFGPEEIQNIGLGAVAGRPPEEWGQDPMSYDEMRPGCFELAHRIEDMNVGGVLGSMCFPTFPGFAGRLFSAGYVEPEAALAVIRAYNDWHVDAWCAGAPGRFIPQGLVPLWDPGLAAAEARRLADRGCHVVSFPESPEPLGFPTLHNPAWDPLWRTCSDLGTILSMHFGSSGVTTTSSSDAPPDAMITLSPSTVMKAAADLVWSPVLRNYPDLRFAMSEGGIGWVPYFLDRIDGVYDKHRPWTHQDFGTRRPSDVVREQIIFCFVYDNPGLALRDMIGIEHITWEMDYPHSDSTWPYGPEEFFEGAQRAGLSDEEMAKISHESALRLFRFDPFRHLPREECTVGALRAKAAHVDTTPRPGKELAASVAR
jgi:predicted TIM-barrel fold metal-dependent hydrolase